jgi:disulfide bond formation protein DsbB
MVLFFAYLTLLGQILLVSGVLLFMLKILNKSFVDPASKISKNAIPLGFLVASAAALGSLIFSEFLGFSPCKLCWFQRIFMYPQVIILGTALMINDRKVRIYSLVLSLIGLVIAVYHILLQIFPAVLRCTDEVAKCSTVQFATFGYITIPVMSATAFALIALLMIFGITSKR